MSETTPRQRLEMYIETDEIYQQYLRGELENPNDFEMFCIQHCEDIRLCLDIVENVNEFLDSVPLLKEETNDNTL